MSEDTPDETGAVAVSPGAAALGDAAARREALKQVFVESRGCTRCAQLVGGRTQVVFGAGHADASLMLVGAAPTAREDEEGTPFTGAAGKLLEDLLGSIGLARADVFVTHVLKCRPPGNRDADPSEVARCRPYLLDQIALVRPRVVCTLGNFATRALTGDPTAVTQRHGQPEVVELGGVAVYVMPLYHPAAALYTRALLDTLRDDVSRLPELLARPALPQPEPAAEAAAPSPDGPGPADELAPGGASDGPGAPEDQPGAPAGSAADRSPAVEEPPQLGLF
ncbi:MAG: uracil-DNA glycosylase [Solirubrobacteraceae bacterium]|nr:uracil-DNA glycosylase [Solirubrobacteraceae bacterium]